MPSPELMLTIARPIAHETHSQSLHASDALLHSPTSYDSDEDMLHHYITLYNVLHLLISPYIMPQKLEQEHEP